ncbi:hypothetical protein K523DRAFT_78243 [Schizophyllum commune Tattone D]|nr:hypothetical protein K523DRAFT_78243 [Schizophyllum commune Tattone D]
MTGEGGGRGYDKTHGEIEGHTHTTTSNSSSCSPTVLTGERSREHNPVWGAQCVAGRCATGNRATVEAFHELPIHVSGTFATAHEACSTSLLGHGRAPLMRPSA